MDSDEQLDTTTETFGQTITVEAMIQYSLVAHASEHLAGIQSAAAS